MNRPEAIELPAEAPDALAAPQVVLLSAASEFALLDTARHWAAFFEHTRSDPSVRLEDVAYSAAVRRSHHAFRAALVVRSLAELAETCARLGRGDRSAAACFERVQPQSSQNPVFVFSGQGSQWPGMGKGLLEYRTAAFRRTIERCEAAIQRRAGWSLLAQLTAAEEIRELTVLQPTLFAMQLALAEQWLELGVKPAAVIGHSLGEVAAACFAGMLEFDDAIDVVCTRSTALHRICGQGAMLVASMPADELQILLDSIAGRMSIAVVNSKTTTVVSGNAPAIAELEEILTGMNVFARRVKGTNGAGHSPLVDPILPDMRTELARLKPRAGTVPFYSTALSRWVDGAELGAEYWCANARNPVMFARAVHVLREASHGFFLEVSPHPILRDSIEECLASAGGGWVAESTQRDGSESAAMLTSLGRMHALGVAVDWRATHDVPGRRHVPLPTYRWEHRRFWFESSDTPAVAVRKVEVDGAYDLLEQSFVDRSGCGLRYYQCELENEDERLTKRALGEIALLGHQTALEMIRQAVSHASAGVGGFVFTELTLPALLTVPPGRGTRLQLTLRERDEAPGFTFELHGSDTELSAGKIVLQGRVAWPDERKAIVEPSARFGCSGGEPGEEWRSIELRCSPPGTRGGYLDALLSALEREGLLDADPAPIFAESVAAIFSEGAPDRTAARARIHVRAVGSERALVDANVYDGDGNLLERIRELLLSGRKSDVAELEHEHSLARLCYRVDWIERSRARLDRVSRTHAVLVVERAAHQADDYCALLAKQSVRFVRVPLQERGQKVAERLNAGETFSDLVCFMGKTGPESAPLAQSAQCFGAFQAMSRAVHKLKVANRPRIWLVTRGAFDTSSVGEDACLAASFVWGVGRVLMFEDPDNWGGLIDLPLTKEGGDAHRLFEEVQGGDREPWVSWADGARRVPRLRSHPIMASQPRWRSQGSYVVLDGTTALGLQTAEWIASKRVRRVVLVERAADAGHADRARIDGSCERIAALGVEVTCLRGNSAELAAGLAALPLASVRGVMYPGDLWEAAPFSGAEATAAEQQTIDDCTWLLACSEALRDAPLDFFVLGSTIGAVTGAAWGASQAMTHQFLAGLAAQLRRRAKPAFTLWWSPWRCLHLRSDGAEARARAFGVNTLELETALDLLDRLIWGPPRDIAIASFDWPKFSSWYAELPSAVLMSELQAREVASPQAKAALLDARSLEDCRRRVTELVSGITSEVLMANGRVLDRHLGFFQMGMDSLMVKQLSVQTSNSTGVQVPVSALFGAPTISDLSDYVANAIWQAQLDRSQKDDVGLAVDDKTCMRDVGLELLSELKTDVLRRVEGETP